MVYFERNVIANLDDISLDIKLRPFELKIFYAKSTKPVPARTAKAVNHGPLFEILLNYL
jgi:hypothetical protein